MVGTPGRIADLIREQALDVHKAGSLVIDEADLMLDMGFLEDVDFIGSHMPEGLQMLVFSATIPEKLKPFLKKYMANPRYAHVEPKHITAEKIEHVLIPSRHRDKNEPGRRGHDPFKSVFGDCFRQYKNNGRRDRRLSDGQRDESRTSARGAYAAGTKKVMKQIGDLEFTYIIATDLAARGIDIKGVSHVINYELPDDLDFYVHRVGRTARAGTSGTAMTFYDTSDEDALVKLEQMGIVFENMRIEKGEWKKIDDRKRRQNRKRTPDETDEVAKRLVKKPRKVKPGYKKKMQTEIQKIKRQQKRKQFRKGK